jgi:hypothetical protein
VHTLSTRTRHLHSQPARPTAYEPRSPDHLSLTCPSPISLFPPIVHGSAGSIPSPLPSGSEKDTAGPLTASRTYPIATPFAELKRDRQYSRSRKVSRPTESFLSLLVRFFLLLTFLTALLSDIIFTCAVLLSIELYPRVFPRSRVLNQASPRSL